MKNRIFKISVAALLIAVMALSLFSCAGKKMGEASGGWEGISWTFKDGVLSITGSGNMPTAASSDKVSWASVRTGVEKVVFYPLEGKAITSISDYAFYGMTKLTDIYIPDSVTSIGKASFAFCSSLKSIKLPAALTKIGDSSFEGCVALENITVPDGVSSLGARSFAFCRALKSVLVRGNISAIGDWTFKNCAALESITLRDTFDKTKISANAFEGAKIGADKIKQTDAIGQSIAITVYYKDADGKELRSPVSDGTKQLGDQYTFVAPTVEGYTLVGEQTVSGTVDKAVIDITFTYKKNVETEETKDTAATPDTTPKPEEKEEKNSVSTIIALAIFGVVIVGICVGAFLLIRSDKKQKKNGTTVRKNDKDNDKKKGKRK